MYAKSFVLYKVIDYLYDKVGTDTIAEWIDHLEPVYVTDRQFVMHVSDDALLYLSSDTLRIITNTIASQ